MVPKELLIKSGLKTTEFYLASFVSIIGAIAGFLPSDSPLVRAAGIASAVLATLGYTASRTAVKTKDS